MSSQSSTLLSGFSNTIHRFFLSSPAKYPSNFFFVGPKDEQLKFDVRLQCKAVLRPRTEEYTDVSQNGLPLIKWSEIVEDDIEGGAVEVSVSNKIKQHVNFIRSMLGSMNDGEISTSAYDTAWVALVQDIHGSGSPQFPSSLQWIANNQLSDGSWGDTYIFSAHDRIINTLACVIALKSWNIHHDKCEKGLLFIKENMHKLGNESDQHMPIGFEVAFPSLIEMARKLDIEVPDDSQVLEEIYAKRNLKLRKIPKHIMHTVPTTLLHSLEGMPELDWEKLLQLQCPDGSFLFSPSSTAFALMQTKDDNCLAYLNRAVERFGGGVPNVYPVDLFEHIWAVDRLERLGISRYYQSEIKECVDYVYRYWTEEGICWAKNSPVQDIDDTAMGFRILRLHGYEVSADVFRHFEKGGEFFCFRGQSNQAVTGMFNLYRASQVLFPGEKILEDAKKFSSQFLREKQAKNELLDKWIITKDLPGEVGYALDLPWYASLPRVETRFYIEQYGGENDVWIGKTLYRMPCVNNNLYLEHAKLDYNKCQALHMLEWDNIQKWYESCNLGEFGMSKRSLLFAYYLAAANLFEPERSNERLAWAKTSVLIDTIRSYFDKPETSDEQRRVFIQGFRKSTYSINGRYNKPGERLVRTLLGTVNQLSLDVMVVHGKDIRYHSHQAWETWMRIWIEGGDRYELETQLLVHMLNLCAGHSISKELLSNPDYQCLSHITNGLCYKLRQFQQVHHTDISDEITSSQIESDMQKLVRLVLSADSIDPDIKKTFLIVAKSFYYTSFCSSETIRFHISKVLFEKVG